MACHISVRDIDFHASVTGVRIRVTTDVPCHLFVRLSSQTPRIHKTPSIRRGVAFAEDVRFCFTVFEDNEQFEAGDTVVHTWWKPNWPVCTTKWLYVWGSRSGEVCVSTTAPFKYHNDGVEPVPLPQEIVDYPFLFSARTLQSTHGTWATCRGGSGVAIQSHRLDPNYYLSTHATQNASYWLRRAHLTTWLPALPAGYSLASASIRLKPHSHTDHGGSVYITQAVHGEPLDIGDWAPQNAYNTVLGEIALADVIDDEWNDIPFNPTGLDYLASWLAKSDQRASFDLDASGALNLQANLWWAQTFTPHISHTFREVRLRLRRLVGSPRTIECYLYATAANGRPTGPVLASGTTTGSGLTTAAAGQWRLISMSPDYSLDAGTLYALVVGSPTSNSSNRPGWCYVAGDPYKRGQVYDAGYQGGPWYNDYPTYDAIFIEYYAQPWSWDRFCLRSGNDVFDTLPGFHSPNTLNFYCPQKGAGYQPVLRITYNLLP